MPDSTQHKSAILLLLLCKTSPVSKRANSPLHRAKENLCFFQDCCVLPSQVEKFHCSCVVPTALVLSFPLTIFLIIFWPHPQLRLLFLILCTFVCVSLTLSALRLSPLSCIVFTARIGPNLLLWWLTLWVLVKSVAVNAPIKTTTTTGILRFLLSCFHLRKCGIKRVQVGTTTRGLQNTKHVF